MSIISYANYLTITHHCHQQGVSQFFLALTDPVSLISSLLMWPILRNLNSNSQAHPQCGESADTLTATGRESIVSTARGKSCGLIMGDFSLVHCVSAALCNGTLELKSEGLKDSTTASRHVFLSSLVTLHYATVPRPSLTLLVSQPPWPFIINNFLETCLCSNVALSSVRQLDRPIELFAV